MFDVLIFKILKIFYRIFFIIGDVTHPLGLFLYLVCHVSIVIDSFGAYDVHKRDRVFFLGRPGTFVLRGIIGFSFSFGPIEWMGNMDALMGVHGNHNRVKVVCMVSNETGNARTVCIRTINGQTTTGMKIVLWYEAYALSKFSFAFNI